MTNQIVNDKQTHVVEETSGQVQATILRSGTVVFASTKNEVKLPLSADTRALFDLLKG